MTTAFPDSCHHWIAGAGYLGQRLASVLGSVRLIDRADKSISLPQGALEQGDAADDDFLLRLKLRHGSPAFFYACCATRGGDVADYRQCYCDVVKVARRVFPTARLLFCSSISIHGAANERTDILREAEAMTLDAGGIVLRLGALYGPGRSVLWPRFLEGEEPVAGPARRQLNYVHVDDVLRAIPFLLDAEKGVYEIVSESLTQGELLAMLQELEGTHQELIPRAGSQRSSCPRAIDSAKLRAFGWVPRVTLREFLREDRVNHSLDERRLLRTTRG